MCRNVQLINHYFPDWRIYITLGLGVPEDIIEALGSQRNIVFRKTGKEGGINMHLRFFAFDEADVDVMVVRDADSRVHARDRWCIERWLSSDRRAMITRDHMNHNNNILGGLWGIRKGCFEEGITIAYLYRNVMKILMSADYTFEYGDDQNILSEGMYPLLVEKAVIFTDIPERVYEGEYTEKIGVPVVSENFCGQVVEFNEEGKEVNTVKYIYMINGQAHECVD